MRLQISEDHTHLLRDGKHFFWLADTCWSAFTNISDAEWIEYLDIRAGQGFNVLQINALPQWDRCGTLQGWQPFSLIDGMRYDFSVIQPDYFAGNVSGCRGPGVHTGAGCHVVQLCAGYMGQ